MTIERAAAAIKEGDVETLAAMLGDDPELTAARLANGRSLLHVATDWPGHFPNVVRSIELLLEAGADPDVAFPHPTNPLVAETPLHWAASSDDVAAATVLLDGGATVDALGGIFDGCPPFTEAIIFEQYATARLLLERGATPWLPGAAALGMADEVEGFFDGDVLRTDISRLPHVAETPPAQQTIDRAFQFACRAGHLAIAQRLLALGADATALIPDGRSASEAAEANGHGHVVDWLATLDGQR